MPPKNTPPTQGSTPQSPRGRRPSKTLSLAEPQFVFEANVDCMGDETLTPAIKEGAYATIQGLLTQLGWIRDGPCLFQKLIDVRTGDVAAAELEFVESVEAIVNSPEMADVNITWLRVTFNSSAIKFI